MEQLRQGGFLIAKVHQLAGRVFARKLKQYSMDDINPAQGRILFALWQGDNIPIQELAARTSLKKTTLTSMLDRLQDAGHIIKSPSPNDGRETLVRLTEQSRVLREDYARVSSEMVDLFYRGLSVNEIDQFEGCLMRILDNLEKAELGIPNSSGTPA